MRASLTDIQQDFVRRYMDDNGIIGVRIREIEGSMALLIEVDDSESADLPSTFRGLPVAVREGRPAVLAHL